MQNPYIVGRWVRGPEHYDRQGLIEHLLHAQETAIWVVGTRRMGKTSLLRQIELLTDRPESGFVPLFWDLQGCTSTEDLNTELILAFEDVADRFAPLGVEVEMLRGEDAVTNLRRINRWLLRQEKRLLLLVDEAEVLIDIGLTEAAWLARMRKALQEGHQRTIIASTKLLSQLTTQSIEWHTSPFLFGFHLVNLWTLQSEGAAALIRQTQSDTPVAVDDAVLEEILRCTNHHPYLIQVLCQRLHQSDGNGGYTLRPIEESDLAVDHLLGSFFAVDYQRLSLLEQRILLTVAETASQSLDELATVVGEEQSSRLPAVLNSLQELGHLRRAGEEWVIGSEFLKRWLAQHMPLLREALEQPSAEAVRLDETNIEMMARQLGVSAERLRALTQLHISSEPEFFDVVRTFLFEIRHLVEQDDGHKLLLTRGEDGDYVLRTEEEVQIALKHWLRPMCKSVNIDLDREPLTGRGLLDFKFSMGHDLRCLVEVKLFNNPKLLEGLSIQLPIYLLSDRAKYGIYVPIFLETEGYEEELTRLKEAALERARTHMVVIDVIDIRAWKPKSASKANRVEAIDRYANPQAIDGEMSTAGPAKPHASSGPGDDGDGGADS